MGGRRITTMATALCVALSVGSAWAAENSPFVGRWRWNPSQSTIPTAEPVLKDFTVEISRAESSRLSWSLTAVTSQGQPDVMTFDAPADGKFYPMDNNTTAAFRLTGGTLQATFNGPTGQTDALTCTLAPDRAMMTCRGVLSDNEGHTTNYVDVFDRM